MRSYLQPSTPFSVPQWWQLACQGRPLTERPDRTEPRCISHMTFSVISPPSQCCCTCPHMSWVQEPWELILIWWFPGHTFFFFFMWQLSSLVPWWVGCLCSHRGGALWQSPWFQHFVSWSVYVFLSQYLTVVPENKLRRVHCQAFLSFLMALCEVPSHRRDQPVGEMAPVSWTKLLQTFDCKPDAGLRWDHCKFPLTTSLGIWGRILGNEEDGRLEWPLPLPCCPCSCWNLNLQQQLPESCGRPGPPVIGGQIEPLELCFRGE